MARHVKRYRKSYREFFLLREDLQYLIELFQTYCSVPTILIDGVRIEHPNDLNFLTQTLAAEVIATGRALYPTIVDPITGIGPILQLRITKGKAYLFVNADARSDFQELINQLGSLFSKNSLNLTRLITAAIRGGLIPGIAGVEFQGIGHLGIYTSNFLLFWIFNCLWTAFSVGLAVWLLATLIGRIAPRFILSLGDTYARKMRTRRQWLDIIELGLVIPSLVGIYALIYTFWIQLGFH